MGPRSSGCDDSVMSTCAQKFSEWGHRWGKALQGWLIAVLCDILEGRCLPAGSGNESS